MSGALASLSRTCSSSLQQPRPGRPLPALLPVPASPTAVRSHSIKFVDSPNPDWVAPQNQPAPHDPDDMYSVDPSVADKASLYTLMISAIVPRPVGFVGTVSSDGTQNLAPFTYFNVVANAPPVIVLGISRSPSKGVNEAGQPRYKDTMQNILDTKEFTCSIISEWFVESANHCAGEFDISEFEQSGLTPVPSTLVKAPRVRESAVQLECRLRHVEEIVDKDGNNTTTVVLADVVMIHVAKAVTGKSPTGKLVVDFEKLKPVARLAGYMYGRVTEIYEIPGPDKQGNYPPKKKTAVKESMR